MMPEQGALLSKAYDSVRAAKLLSDAGLYDFAVSRAYYGHCSADSEIAIDRVDDRF